MRVWFIDVRVGYVVRYPRGQLILELGVGGFGTGFFGLCTVVFGLASYRPLLSSDDEHGIDGSSKMAIFACALLKLQLGFYFNSCVLMFFYPAFISDTPGFRQWLSETLGDKRVQKVEISRRLVGSPATLVQSAYGMSPTMARYMRAQAVAFGEVDTTMTGQQQVNYVTKRGHCGLCCYEKGSLDKGSVV